MLPIIRGRFNDDEQGRILYVLSASLDYQVKRGLLLAAVKTCELAQEYTDDPQWGAVKNTLLTIINSK